MNLYKVGKKLPENFILDLDGVFTDGSFQYTKKGKVSKVFGADDHEAIKILSSLIKVNVVTADERGYEISKKRISEDMKLPIELISAKERPNWVISNFNCEKTIYMGDGLLDPLVFRIVYYSIAPSNALPSTKSMANFVTKNKGGERAVAEACIHIMHKFFDLDLLELL